MNINTPSTPNYLLVGKDKTPIHVSEFSEKQLIEVADKWKRELLIKASEKRKKP